MVENPAPVAQLMARFRAGDPGAAGELVEVFYPQLKKIAKTRMRNEDSRHTWQPTALVNELYLELRKVRALRPGDESDEEERRAFLHFSAHLMRRLLIHHSRPLAKQAQFLSFDEHGSDRFASEPDRGSEALCELDDALDRLGQVNPNLRTVVELRVFEGLTGDEIAERMGASPRSIARWWNFARDWMSQEFGANGTL
jgi:RNA polymerase sigma factor (TIGR02999 family)